MINTKCLACYLTSNMNVSMRMYWMDEESIFALFCHSCSCWLLAWNEKVQLMNSKSFCFSCQYYMCVILKFTFIVFISSSYVSRIWLTVFCRCFCSRPPIGREQHCTDQWKSSWSRRILPALCSCFDCVCSASFGTIKVSLPLFILTFESWQPKLLLTKWRKMLWSYEILFWRCKIWFLWFISTTGTIFQTCKDMRRLKIG